MASPTSESCTITGSQYLSTDEDNGEICARFQKRLVSVLGEAAVSSFEISIDVSKSGTINAVVSRLAADELTPLMTMSVDVMDRPLSLGDLDQLADAVANALANDKTTA